MIRLEESGRQRDGTRWRARIRPGSASGLRGVDLYFGLGRDQVPGYLFIEDGKWARCLHENELELVEPAREVQEAT